MSISIEPAGRRRSFRHASAVLRNRWPQLLGVVVLGLITAVAGLAGPWVVGRLVDLLLVEPEMSVVITHVLVILGAGAVAALGSWAGAVLLAQAVEPSIASLREEVLGAGLSLEADELEETGRGELVSRVVDDSRIVSEAATNVLPLVVSATFTVGVSAVGMAALDWRFGLIGLVAVPLYWTTLRAYLPPSGRLYRRQREAFAVRTQRLLGAVEGAATLRAFAAEKVELRRVDDASARARDLDIEVFRFVTGAFSRNNRAEAIVLVLILGAGFWMVSAGEVTVGEVSTAALVFHRLFGPIGTLTGMVDQLQSAGASLVRMVGVIDLAAGRTAGTRTDAHPSVGIRLEGVGHRYRQGTRNRRVVDDVSLTLSPGEHVAVVGASGAGKSTLARIVAGLLTPTDGAVWLGGVPAAELTPAARREMVCMISQETHAFRGSVVDNVRVAKPEADVAAAREALATVGATDWVEALPHGEDTVIGAGGHRLTGLQLQMLALARVQLADPAVVVLDEATAEAGSGGARQLDLASRAVIRGRSALTVAHRLDQAASADRIVVMRDGQVAELGTHAELLRADGTYARLWTAWERGNRLSTPTGDRDPDDGTVTQP